MVFMFPYGRNGLRQNLKFLSYHLCFQRKELFTFLRGRVFSILPGHEYHSGLEKDKKELSPGSVSEKKEKKKK